MCKWPAYSLPNLSFNQSEHNFVVVLWSKNSGTGSIKLMDTFIHKNGSQRVSGLLFLAEDRDYEESFLNLDRVFGQFGD